MEKYLLHIHTSFYLNNIFSWTMRFNAEPHVEPPCFIVSLFQIKF